MSELRRVKFKSFFAGDRNQRRAEPTNLEALDRFWRRSSFYDEPIEQIAALNKRVVIRLNNMTLVITGAAGLKPCELPAIWFDHTISLKGNQFVLDVASNNGHLVVTGSDVRLIRNNDLAGLIPPIDS